MTRADMDVASVSVVIPAFRAKATIARAIESVAEQTQLPLEVIVVDDGSWDGTGDFVRRLISQYEGGWLKVLELEDNQGAASARNAGWEVARGEFIAFLDADDSWHPNKIEYQYEYMRAHPEVVLCGHGHRIMSDDFDGELIDHAQSERIRPYRLLLSNPFVTPSIMVKANVPFRFSFGKRHMEDHLLWMEIALSNLYVARLAAPLAMISKPLYGVGGLSSQMWKMEKSELHNYWYLRASGKIGLLTTVGLSVFSLAKYMRRLIIVGFRRVAVLVRGASRAQS